MRLVTLMPSLPFGSVGSVLGGWATTMTRLRAHERGLQGVHRTLARENL